MSDDIIRRREAFRQFAEARGGPAKLARTSKVSATTLYSYLDGKSASMLDRTTSKIATATGVSVEEMFGGERPTRTVPVVYHVGAGASVYALSGQEPFNYVEGPDDATDETVAGKIEGTSLGEMFDGWLIFWDDMRSPVTPDLHNEVCVVSLYDDRMLVKKIRPSREPGLFHLFSNTEPPILDVPIRWAAKITGMKPR
ncbi:hypothetical protein [Brevundimonas sp.]|uniref:hypothetical protein n=1 Tax=Brevundimonas sp. TaxID=1871086 RepID=UPI0025BFCB6B|nr:hypothetical protein [Brevundimonas sp.]